MLQELQSAIRSHEGEARTMTCVDEASSRFNTRANPLRYMVAWQADAKFRVKLRRCCEGAASVGWREGTRKRTFACSSWRKLIPIFDLCQLEGRGEFDVEEREAHCLSSVFQINQAYPCVSNHGHFGFELDLPR